MLPIGRYIRLMRYAESFVPDILAALFPEMEEGPILTRFQDITLDGFREFLSRAMAVVPERICEIAGGLLNIPKERLFDPDDGLTPVELLEVLIELWEVNDLSNFFPLVRKLLSQMGSSAQNTGSSAGLE